MSNLLGFTCTVCGAEYLPHQVEYVCPKHGDEGILDASYDYKAISEQSNPRDLATRRNDSQLTIFRYLPFLPISQDSKGLPLKVGWTPLVRAPRLEQELGLRELWIKDESVQPTASFKDRASAIVLVRALEEGRSTVTTASSGNAGIALAGLAASVGIRAVIYVPRDMPQPKLAQLSAYGSEVVLVDGSYDDAYDLCLEATKKHGWYCRNTAYNPLTIEGKKTASFEICEQLHWKAPDRIFVSVGDGNIISSLWKGLEDLTSLGWIESLPKLMGIQAAGAASCFHAWSRGLDEPEAVSADTIADSIRVGLPKDGRRALRSVRKTGGAFLSVDDEEILTAVQELGSKAGIYADPASAAAYAGLYKAVQTGQTSRNDRTVLIITARGRT